jgi:hypothetical protein
VSGDGASRTVAIAHALLAGATAALFLLAPLSGERLARALPPEALLPGLLGIAAGCGFLLLPAALLAAREAGEASPRALALGALAALAGGGPAIGAAFGVASAGVAGLARAAAVVALLAAIAGLAAIERRISARAVMLAVVFLAAMPPLFRYIAIATLGRRADWLALASPLEAPAALLATPPPARRPAPEPPRRGALCDLRVESGTHGVFRPGIPTPVAISCAAEGAPPLVFSGAEPPFAAAPLDRMPDGRARAALLAVLRAPRDLGPHLEAAASGIGWRALGPAERVRLVVDPSGGRLPRGSGAVSVPALPPFPALRAFDGVSLARGATLTAKEADRVAANEALLRDRGGAPRPEDPSIDPDRYCADEPPGFPRDLRLALGATAIAGSLFVIAAAALPGRRGAVAGPLAGLMGGALALVFAPSGRALASERAIFWLAPDSAVAAEARSIEVSTPLVPARADFAIDASFESLEPVLFRIPEPAPSTVVLDPRTGPRAVLGLGTGERRIFDAWRVRRLAGPIEVRHAAAGALRVLNRTGIDFEIAMFVGPRGAALLGPLPDGAAFEVAAGGRIPFADLGDRLEARGREGRALRGVLAHLLGGRPGPEGGRLVLVARPERPIVRGIPVEVRPAIAIVPLK